MPVFSVDYRLAPKNPFPDPINDAYQGYYWLITQLRAHMGIIPETVIVTGDSAGGQVAVAVANLAILRNFRVPDGLLLHYPAANCNPNHFLPSQMLTLDDMMCSFNLLLYVSHAFTRRGGNTARNCLISTIYTPKSLLKQFPVTKVFLAEVDPLRDMGITLALNMKKAGVLVEIFYF